MKNGPKTGSEVPAGSSLPARYAIKEIERERFLTCLEAPNLYAQIEKSFTVSASTARKSPQGTIFLDGAAQSEPFLDHERQVYNFDHHEGCVRTFTLATCEQVLVMIMKGLDLRDREWNIFANEPDLDTILSIWLIFNHQRISRKERLPLRFLFGLVRLEGVIDSYGLDLKELSALPPENLRKTQQVIDHLRKDEINLKRDGLWDEIDYMEYTASILHKIDRIIYKSFDFTDFKGVEELARAELINNRMIAVVDSDMGIYELEPHLDKLYGDRLGVAALRKSPHTYTLRRMDLFMPVDLESVYDKLNFLDPAVKCRTDRNKWGGSADIGGSPRSSGTKLTPLQIAQACRNAMQKPDILQQVYRFFKTILLVAAIILAAEICRFIWPGGDLTGGKTSGGLLHNPDFGFIVTLFLFTAIALAIYSFRKTWQFGIITPVGKDWWFILPVMILSGFAGGVWLPLQPLPHVNIYGIILAICIIAPLAFELLFRSLAHGILAQSARIQHCNSRWSISWPSVGAALMYAGLFGYMLRLVPESAGPLPPGWLLGKLFGAFIFGLAAGIVRERSHSVLPAYLFHVITATCAALVPNTL